MNGERSKGRKQVRVMPAIREESSLKTSRIPVHIIPPGASMSRAPLQKSMIIQTLPDEPKKHPPKVTPGTRYHDNVEQVVADYLHFSRYDKVLPVTQGFAPLACACCQDRNRENVQLQRERNRPPPKADVLVLEPAKMESPVPGPSNGSSSPQRNADPLQPGHYNHHAPYHDPSRAGGDTNGHGRHPPAHQSSSFPSSWMEYQPLPYAHTYLNSEFNRAIMLRGYEEDRKHHDDASAAYVNGRVLSANTKYDLAMDRLQRSLQHNFD